MINEDQVEQLAIEIIKKPQHSNLIQNNKAMVLVMKQAEALSDEWTR